MAPSTPRRRAAALPLLAALLLASLTACMPVANNSAAGAIDLDALEPDGRLSLELGVGTSWYLTEAFAPGTFGYSVRERNDHLDGSVLDADVGETLVARVGGYALGDVIATRGVEIELVRATLEREVVDSGAPGARSPVVSFVDRVRVLYRVYVPVEAAPGHAVVMARLTGPDGTEVPVQFGIDIDHPLRREGPPAPPERS